MRSKRRKTIALIAHDGKKAEMVAFVRDHLKFFKLYDLIATGHTRPTDPGHGP